jgi:hypothetical protein
VKPEGLGDVEKDEENERDFFPRPGNVDDVSHVDPTGFKII